MAFLVQQTDSGEEKKIPQFMQGDPVVSLLLPLTLDKKHDFLGAGGVSVATSEGWVGRRQLIEVYNFLQTATQL